MSTVDDLQCPDAICLAFGKVDAVFFSINGAFVSTISELPDISNQNTQKSYQKGHIIELIAEKMTSRNSIAAFFSGVRKTLTLS